MTTWCDLPYSVTGQYEVDELTSVQSDMAIVGIPMDAGASGRNGQDAAPQAIRALESFESWHDPVLGDLSTLKAVDAGDAVILRTQPHEDLAAHAEWLSGIANNTDCLVTLGGDHSVTSFVLQTIRPMMRGAHLVHIDAHGDCWPMEFEDALFPGHESWVPWVAHNRHVDKITQMGVRAMGPPMPASEALYNSYPGTVSKLKVDAFAGYLRKAAMPVYLSVDMDVVDPAFCPGVAYPEPGGWTGHQLLYTIEQIVASGQVTAVDLVEVTPALDRDNLSVRLAHRSVLAVMRGIKRAKS